MRPDKITLPKGAGKARGNADVDIKRKGPYGLQVSTRIDIADSRIEFELNYKFDNTDISKQMLDLFESQYHDELSDIIPGGVNTAEEAVEFFIAGFERIGKISRDNTSVIVESED